MNATRLQWFERLNTNLRQFCQQNPNNIPQLKIVFEKLVVLKHRTDLIPKEREILDPLYDLVDKLYHDAYTQANAHPSYTPKLGEEADIFRRIFGDIDKWFPHTFANHRIAENPQRVGYLEGVRENINRYMNSLPDITVLEHIKKKISEIWDRNDLNDNEKTIIKSMFENIQQQVDQNKLYFGKPSTHITIFLSNVFDMLKMKPIIHENVSLELPIELIFETIKMIDLKKYLKIINTGDHSNIELMRTEFDKMAQKTITFSSFKSVETSTSSFVRVLPRYVMAEDVPFEVKIPHQVFTKCLNTNLKGFISFYDLYQCCPRLFKNEILETDKRFAALLNLRLKIHD
jgi:hypothetical protein